MKTYQTTVMWDTTLTDIECVNSQYAPLELQGLVSHAKKVSGTAPDAVAGKFAQGATILNLVTGEWYRNTGTTDLPIWTVWSV